MKVRELIEKLQQFDPEAEVALESLAVDPEQKYYNVYKSEPRYIEGVTLREGFWPNTGWTEKKDVAVVSLNETMTPSERAEIEKKMYLPYA